MKSLVKHQVNHRLFALVGAPAVLRVDTVGERDDQAGPPAMLFAPCVGRNRFPGIAVEHRRIDEVIERSKAKKDAIYYSERLEKMRELYKTYYPLDATGNVRSLCNARRNAA